MKFIIDTGADVSIITEDTVRELGCGWGPPKRKLCGAGGRPLKVKGEAELRIQGKERLIKVTASVVEGARANLLGKREIKELGIVKLVGRINVEASFPELYGELGTLPEEFQIKLKEGAVPFAIHVPRRLPIGLRAATERELERMERMGVIERVEEYREWCAGMVVAPKTNGDVRICVDLSELNKSVKRETFPLPRVEDTLAMLEGSKVFSKMDANSGFWQVGLSRESRKLTTFLTPFGRFQFCKMPFGISAAPEFFQRQMMRILEGIRGVVCMMDDVLVFGRDQREHDDILKIVLKRMRRAGLTLNREKCEFNRDRIKFLGHVISGRGIEADPDKVKAITEMPRPQSKKELKSFLGMVNYLAKFNKGLAELERPLRDLTRKRAEFAWGSEQEESFEKIKSLVTQAPILVKFSLSKNHRVTADSSCFALGAALLQQEREGWRPVAYLSRALTDTEKRYAQMEKEALAITWACERLDFYLAGRTFEVETDHSSLVKLLGTRDLADMPLRCQRFKMRLMRYSYTIFHTPGKEMHLADLLSRPGSSKKEESAAQRVEMHVRRVMRAEEAQRYGDGLLEEVARRGREDKDYQRAIRHIENQWRENRKNYRGLREYYAHRNSLTVVDELIMHGERVVIPAVMRKEMMDRLHEGHLGADKCWKRAREGIWWPGMRKDLNEMVGKCNECIKHQVMKRQPLRNTELPGKPWIEVGTDLFKFEGNPYLLVVDYYSRWIETERLRDMTALEVIRRMELIFSRLGVPERVRSDNGPCYCAREFREFAENRKFEHDTSSPRYPESNGMAERAVKTVKGMWKKEKNKANAMLAYRCTPLESGYSPAQLLYGRNLRSTVYSRVEKSIDIEDFRQRDAELKRGQKDYADNRRRAKKLVELKKGDRVWVKDSATDKGKEGHIIERSRQPDSYWVEIEGRAVRRNRVHCRKLYDKQQNDVVKGQWNSQKETDRPGKEERQWRPYVDTDEVEMEEESEGSEGVSGTEESESDRGNDGPEEDSEEEEEEETIESEAEPSPQGVQLRRSGREVKKGHLRDDFVYY